MSTMRHALRVSAGVAIAAIAAMSSGAFAAEAVTKDEAVAMVKKAVVAIKAEGADKAYAEIGDPSGPFVDRELYIAVYGLDGMVLAHGANKSRVGTNQIDDKDADGKTFVKERVDLAKQSPSFWQAYKFMNPVIKKVGRSRCIANGLTRRQSAAPSISSIAGEEKLLPRFFTILAATAALAGGGLFTASAQDDPTNIVADQIRAQGYKCDSPQTAKRDAQASKPDEAVWVLQCESGSYRVRLDPDMGAKVEKIDQSKDDGK